MERLQKFVPKFWGLFFYSSDYALKDEKNTFVKNFPIYT